MIVRVHTKTDEKTKEVLDVLRSLGVSVTTDEGSPEEETLLYISRMNSKLDNLGQLKHLGHLAKYVRDVATLVPILASYLQNELSQQEQAKARRVAYFQYLEESKGLLPRPDFLEWMTFDEIDKYVASL